VIKPVVKTSQENIAFVGARYCTWGRTQARAATLDIRGSPPTPDCCRQPLAWLHPSLYHMKLSRIQGERWRRIGCIHTTQSQLALLRRKPCRQKTPCHAGDAASAKRSGLYDSSCKCARYMMEASAAVGSSALLELQRTPGN